MEHSQSRVRTTVIDPAKYGVSFSLKQCRNFKIDPKETLKFLLDDMGLRRFRLMSYWDEHEVKPGSYDFSALDQQIKQIENASGIITLCLGVRQPRWPESHWPEWTQNLPESEKYDALYKYLTEVVKRFRSYGCISSWQLENEALNRSFGENGDFNRRRLKTEYALVKSLDPHRPLIMTTSNTWGIPLRKPRPDMFGFTMYQTQFESDRYRSTQLPWWWYKLRALKIATLTRRASFIHELQLEPWGPKAIWEMSDTEQSKSMNSEVAKAIIEKAKKTNLFPIDLWGSEWWYWRKVKLNDHSVCDTVKAELNKQ